MKEIKKVLIANRGEIAVRVMKSLKEMGIKSVAVYSDADRYSKYVRMADEAYYIGASPSNESYLKMEKIIEVAKISNTDAIHPGYGFLSENAQFSERLKKEDIIFIGPSASSINMMGDKITARKTVEAYSVPTVPGTTEPIKDVGVAIEVAKKIGFPVMLKASAGGGGKGMRVVHDESEFESSLNMTQREALSSFGDDTVYIEKYLEEPHHIEFQILADKYGNVIHLFERECSVQRRHQKVIEESPSPFIDDKMREEMGDIAKNAALSCNYEGAGTIEFLVDKHKNFYFLEMNTRLQVEHPITEMVVNVDLVKEQIKIAMGEKLSLKQEDIKQVGHAIECRIYAEDAENNFTPSPGKIEYLEEPTGKGIRNDTGVYSGSDVPIFYDPMISKLITYDENRESAINKMITALKDYKIVGIKTNIPLFFEILNHDVFLSGNYDTHFWELYSSEFFKEDEEEVEQLKEIAAAVFLKFRKKENKLIDSVKESSNWKLNGRIGG